MASKEYDLAQARKTIAAQKSNISKLQAEISQVTRTKHHLMQQAAKYASKSNGLEKFAKDVAKKIANLKVKITDLKDIQKAQQKTIKTMKQAEVKRIQSSVGGAADNTLIKKLQAKVSMMDKQTAALAKKNKSLKCAAAIAQYKVLKMQKKQAKH